MSVFKCKSLLAGALVLVIGCTTPSPSAQVPATLAQTQTVSARGETTPVGTANQDAADDPAIWRNAAAPTASLILGTDKKAGLYVYDLSGKVKSFFNAGRVNNVDLRSGVPLNGQESVIVVASDRNDLANAKVAVFKLDTTSATLLPLGTIAAGSGEAYGICMYRDNTGIYAFMVLKDGTINQVKLNTNGALISGEIVRSFKLSTQSEGCVTDERTSRLYVAEEDVGLWRFDASPTGSTTPTKVADVDSNTLVADAEGVALADGSDDKRYIIVSSQGDSAFAVFRASDESYVGRFRLGAGRVGATEETDGIDLVVGDFGPAYPGGLFVAQDGRNAAGAQNFKLVAWDDIAAVLGLNK
jgi:3-phytase